MRSWVLLKVYTICLVNLTPMIIPISMCLDQILGLDWLLAQKNNSYLPKTLLLKHIRKVKHLSFPT